MIEPRTLPRFSDMLDTGKPKRMSRRRRALVTHDGTMIAQDGSVVAHDPAVASHEL